MKKAFRLFSLAASLTMMLAACGGENSSPSASNSEPIPSSTPGSSESSGGRIDTDYSNDLGGSGTSGSESSVPFDDPLVDAESITVDEFENMLEKAKTFTNVQRIRYKADTGDREDYLTYQRHENYFTVHGTANSDLDGYDDPDPVIQYYGFPKDGSVNVYYEVSSGDPAIDYARAYTVVQSASENMAANEIAYADALKRLDNYENSLSNVIDETYGLITTDDSIADPNTFKAGKKVVEGEETFYFTASLFSTLLGTSWETYYMFSFTKNEDGSFKTFYFRQTNSATTNVNAYADMTFTYGDYLADADLESIFDPKQYFVQSFKTIYVYDIYADDGAVNTMTVGSDFYLQPYYPSLIAELQFEYIPQTAVDSYDLFILSSSNEDVIAKDEDAYYPNTYKAVGPGKATLTLGGTYNPYCTTTLEIEVVYATPTSVQVSYPYNQANFTGITWLNSETSFEVDVYPYAHALDDFTVTSSNTEILEVGINDDGKIVVTGKKVGYANVVVTSATPGVTNVSRVIPFQVLEELDESYIAGSYTCDLSSTLGSILTYQFNADNTGIFSTSGLDYSGNTVTTTLAFTYYIDYSTNDIVLEAIGGTINSTLSRVHIYSKDRLYCYFMYGDYYYSVDLTPVVAE